MSDISPFVLRERGKNEPSQPKPKASPLASIFHPTVLVSESTWCPDAKEESNLMDWARRDFGPELEGTFAFPGQISEETPSQ